MKTTPAKLTLWRRFRRFLDRFQRSTGGLVHVEAMRGRWCVMYPDGRHSVAMAYDTASDYASMFGGKVLHVDDVRGNP